MSKPRSGRLLVVSAPSGTGKSTVCAKLRACCRNVGVSISYTTRNPRGRERDGVEYHFVNDPTFDRMIARDEFLEWAQVFGQRYGSSRAEVRRLQDAGKDVLFDIDVQGGQQIKRACSEAVLVFLLPPSMEELVRRLKSRGTEDSEQAEQRLRTAVWELDQGRAYDHHVVNSVLDDAVRALELIRRGRSPKPARQDELLAKLISDASRILGGVQGVPGSVRT